ncbi:MAG: hypothetical protein LBE71_06165 [Dysgonamonadaceae bacterium]|nr:hypothetical protein [Dysgonamonadaceae bacterium]
MLFYNLLNNYARQRGNGEDYSGNGKFEMIHPVVMENPILVARGRIELPTS